MYARRTGKRPPKRTRPEFQVRAWVKSRVTSRAICSLGPIGVLCPKPCRLEVTRRPVEPLRQRQPAFWRHLAKNCELFGTGLFVRQHDHNMGEQTRSGKPLMQPSNFSLMVPLFGDMQWEPEESFSLLLLQGIGSPTGQFSYKTTPS